MAHQVKSGITVRSGPRIVLERPRLAALLGGAAAEWATLEGRVMALYAYLMGLYLPRVEGFSPPTHPVARQVFDALAALRLRLDLLQRLADWVVKEPALSAELKDLVIPSITNAGKLRNTLVHGQWGVATEYPEALILLPTFGHRLVYEESDFDEAIARIADASQTVGNFERKARAHCESGGRV